LSSGFELFVSTELEFVDIVVVDKFELGVVDMIMVDLGALAGVEFIFFRLLADIFVVVMVTYFVVVSTDEFGLFICSEIVLLSTNVELVEFEPASLSGCARLTDLLGASGFAIEIAG
jgi:hypothetical protein